MAIDKILKAVKEEKTIFGAKEALKLLRKNELGEVYLSASCPAKIQSDIEALAKVSSVTVAKLDLNAEELAAQLKKPFPINVVSIRKK